MNRTPSRKTDCNRTVRFMLCLGLAALLPLGLSGCGGEEEKQEEAVQAPAPVPTAPRRPACALDDLRAELQISDKVRLTEAEAPPNCDDRRNLLVFFDAFVNPQADTLREMLSLEDAMQLEAMLNAGQLAPLSDRIREVTLNTGVSPLGRPCVLAMYLLDDGYHAQMWYFKDTSGASSFESVAQPPDVVDRLSGADLVASWFEVLQEERDRASEYDDEVDELSSGQSAPPASSSGNAGGGAPRTPPRRPASPSGPGGPKPLGPKTP